MASVWSPPSQVSRGWPNKCNAQNIVHRVTGGLRECYAREKPPPRHETSADGRLVLSPSMPLLGQRYRFLHAISESDLTQILCAIDTYRHLAKPTSDGRTQPLVAIKVLNAQHWTLGAQESERMRLLWRGLDRTGATGAHILRPLGHFEEGAHFCLVLPLLAPLQSLAAEAAPSAPAAAISVGGTPLHRPQPQRGVQAASSGTTAVTSSAASAAAAVACKPARPRLQLEALRQLTAQLLGALASLHEQSTLHADLKPENLMASAESAASAASLGSSSSLHGGWLGSGVMLIDFSNAMGVSEAPAYYDAYEVTTLGYRAPELLYGLPFGSAIDMWSLGATLAELYTGHALVHAASRGGLAVEYAQLLGRPPNSLYGSSHYAKELLPLVAHTADLSAGGLTDARIRLSRELNAPMTSKDDQMLIDLIAKLLQYDPKARPCAKEALCHPFLAPVFPFRALVASSDGERAAKVEEPAAATKEEGAVVQKEVNVKRSPAKAAKAGSGGSSSSGMSGQAGSSEEGSAKPGGKRAAPAPMQKEAIRPKRQPQPQPLI